MVLADDAVTNWTWSGSSIEDDWCYNDYKGVMWEFFNDDYLSTVPILNGNIQIEINGQSIAADQKFVTLQYMPPYIDMNITTTNDFEGAIKGIFNEEGMTGWSVIRPYQELPIQYSYVYGTPIDQPFQLDILHVIADKKAKTCNVSRFHTIYVTVQHLALPEIGTFEACNICNNDTYHRMDWNENGYIEQFGYKAECPEMQRIALDGRLSDKNCLELVEDNPGTNEGRACTCLYSYNKTREEEQRDWKESGVKAFTPAVLFAIVAALTVSLLL